MVDGRFDVEDNDPLRCYHSLRSFLRDVANDVTDFGMLEIPEAISGFLGVDKCSTSSESEGFDWMPFDDGIGNHVGLDSIGWPLVVIRHGLTVRWEHDGVLLESWLTWKSERGI